MTTTSHDICCLQETGSPLTKLLMRPNINIIFHGPIMAVCILAASCMPDTAVPSSLRPSEPASTKKPTEVTHSLNQTEYALVREVNILRKARGLAPLTVRLNLSKASRNFAKRLSSRTFFGHVSPDGDNSTDRADAVSYDWQRLGETLAAGQPTARAAAQSWRDSPGHAKIIFDQEHVHIGVGYVRRQSEDKLNPQLEHFWVLMAGTTR